MTVDTPPESPRLAAARAGLVAAREPHASGPRPDVEALRVAYLDLLKLSLCDLAASGTTSVGRTPEGRVMSRELTGEQLRLRAAGMDWPLHGLTMVGLDRLDDLQSCVEAVVRERIAGDVIEAGAWRGGASILMRATLDSLGDPRTVTVADSFQGFPVDAGRSGADDLSVFDFLAVSLEEVRASFARLGCADGVRFVPGFFEHTIPTLAGGRWSLVRLDGDTYEATLLSLRCLYPGLEPGGFLIVDDYGALDECRRAVEDYRRDNAITQPIEHVDWTCVRWRRGSEQLVAVDAPPVTAGARHAGAVRTPANTHVPSLVELELQRELAELRGRLGAAERELERRGREPRAMIASWVRRRRRSRKRT